MPEEIRVRDKTVQTCRKSISSKCKWRSSLLFNVEVGVQFADRPTCVLKLSEGGEVLLPCEQENEALHLHEKQPLTQWLHHWLLMQKWDSTMGRKRQWRGFLCCLLWAEKYPLLGRAASWMATTVAGHKTAGGDGSWLQKCGGGVTSAGKALWQQRPWHTEHYTAEVAGRQQRSLTQFIWEEIKYHAIPRSKTAGEVCRTPDVKFHLPSPKH